MAKITVKAMVVANSQSDVKERSEPRMTKNFGRIFERLKTANADMMARPIMIPWTAADTSPVIVISRRGGVSDERAARCSKSSHCVCPP